MGDACVTRANQGSALASGLASESMSKEGQRMLSYAGVDGGMWASDPHVAHTGKYHRALRRLRSGRCLLTRSFLSSGAFWRMPRRFHSSNSNLPVALVRPLDEEDGCHAKRLSLPLEVLGVAEHASQMCTSVPAQCQCVFMPLCSEPAGSLNLAFQLYERK